MKLTCPNRPATTKGNEPLSTREKHEGFHRTYQKKVRQYHLDNGRQWAFDQPVILENEPTGPFVCATCGAEAIVEHPYC